MTSAYDQALRYLSMKMYSSADLADKLDKKGYNTQEINAVIQQLKEEGFLNDVRYGETFIQNLLSYRTFGYYGIRQKLLSKKLDKVLVEDLLGQFVSKEAEEEVATRFRDKNKSKNRDAMIRAMQRKGFRTEVILKVINSSLPNA